jgi:predicted nucleic acid-binding protein
VAARRTFLVDTSAFHRFDRPSVAARLGPLIEANLVATCAIVDLEVLHSARNVATYEAVREERRSLLQAPITPAVMERAIDVQHELAKRGHHRLAIPDLIVAASAEIDGHVVLHYDRDFERIAAVTDQQQQWVVRPGSVP